MICPSCGFTSPPGDRFCGMCGTRIAQICASCSAANPLDYRFCSMCGQPLSGGSTPPPQLSLPFRAPFWDAGAAQPDLDPALSPSAGVQQLEGERRVATVILADVQNSTDLMEHIGTEAWVGLMNQVFQILEIEIYRFGGQVDQFRGDGLVAFFGARVASENDPEHAILAALAMQRAIKPFAARLAEDRQVSLWLRVGVNTGEVIVTSVGDRRQHREDTAMGEAVALAARMETAAEAGTVLVSENTYRHVSKKFIWQPLGEVTVKGISHPVPVYRPLEPVPDKESGLEAQRDRYTVPLTGRIDELQRLTQSIEQLFHGRGGVTLVTGEKGLGKSLLIQQVRQHFVRQHRLVEDLNLDTETPQSDQITWMTGRCRSYDQSWPYSIWRDLIKRWLQVTPEDTGEVALERLQHRAAALWGDQAGLHLAVLSILLSLPVDPAYLDQVRALDVNGVHTQLFVTIHSWVEAIAKRGPVVLLFADIQWADTSSLDLLRYCLPVSDNYPLMWLIVMRPDRQSAAWDLRYHIETDYPHRLVDIQLAPLGAQESREVIEQVIGPDVLAEETMTALIARADGYPYFIQELLYALMTQGILEQNADTGKWRQVRPVTSLDLPESLHSLLIARIDRLLPGERRVLQAAAVIGNVFWSNVLEGLCSEPHHLSAWLSGLQRAQLIHQRSQVPGLGMEYTFLSTLIREAAYESLLSGQRTAYHLQIATYLEENLEVEIGGQFDSWIAYHYRCAGELRKELFYTLAAAEQARQVNANNEALEHYNRALELIDEIETGTHDEEARKNLQSTRFEVLLGRREVRSLSGDLSRAAEDARALLALAEAVPDDPVWMIDALLVQPEVVDVSSLGEIRSKGLPLVHRAHQLAVEIGDRRREMNSLIAISRIQSILKEPAWQETGERALEMARQLSDLRTEVNMLMALGENYGSENPERADGYLQAAMSIYQRTDDQRVEMTLLSLFSPQLERAGDYYRQLTEYEQKRIEISRKLGNKMTEGYALMFAGQIQAIYLGDYANGLEQVKKALHLWESSPSRLYPLLRVAQIQAEMGQYQQAEEALAAARPLAELDVFDLGRAAMEIVTAILYNKLDDPDHYEKVIEFEGKVKHYVNAGLAPSSYQVAICTKAVAAQLALADRAANEEERQRRVRLALESAQIALEIFNAFGYLQIVECTSEEVYWRHSQALAASGRADEAAGYLQMAHEEMMRKYAFIPAGSPYQSTYLENIAEHRQIRAAYQSMFEKQQPASS